jgi:predicted metalloprotease with PDZ domain
MFALTFSTFGCFPVFTWAQKNVPKANSSANASEEFDKYTITFRYNDTVQVTGQLYTKTGILLAIPGFDPDTRSSHIKEFKVRTQAGQTIATRYSATEASWQLAFGWQNVVMISYKVDLSYLRSLPSWARLQYGFFENGGLCLVTRDLFVIADDFETSRKTRLVINSDKQLITPWEPTTAKNVFDGKINEFADNIIVVGDVSSFSLRQSEIYVKVALFGEAAKARGIIEKIINLALGQNIKLFGGSLVNRSLVIISSGDEDGQAYNSSNAISTRVPFSKSAATLWANTIVHEIFHMWNAHSITSEDPGLAFFVEGFTEYYANKELLRSGFINDTQFWNLAAQHLGMYSYYNNHNKESIAEGGKDKEKNRFGVYDGGWAVALCLDLEIRSKTNGLKSLDNVMRLLWEQFGKTGRKMTYIDLKTSSDKVSGKSLNNFFSKYVDGRVELPFTKYLSPIGVKAYTQPFSGVGLVFVSIHGIGYQDFLHH